MKCDNCRKQVNPTHKLYEEEPYNENNLTAKALDKLVNIGYLLLGEICYQKAKR